MTLEKDIPKTWQPRAVGRPGSVVIKCYFDCEGTHSRFPSKQGLGTIYQCGSTGIGYSKGTSGIYALGLLCTKKGRDHRPFKKFGT